jgi:hypothetical protein
VSGRGCFYQLGALTSATEGTAWKPLAVVGVPGLAVVGLPPTTAYSDAGALVDLGLLERDESEKTHTYAAVPAALTVEFDGGMTERVAARELDLQPALGIAVLQVLREVVLETRDHDPCFDRIEGA